MYYEQNTVYYRFNTVCPASFIEHSFGRLRQPAYQHGVKGGEATVRIPLTLRAACLFVFLSTGIALWREKTRMSWGLMTSSSQS